MVKVAFPYPQPYGVFPDIYEYVENLRGLGVDASYIGWRPTGPRLQFLKQLAAKIEEANPDIVHVFHFRGAGLLPLLVRKRKMRWILDVRTIHVENKRLQPERHVWLKTRITWVESQLYDQIFVVTPTIRKYMQPSVRPITGVPLGASAARLRGGVTPGERQRLKEILGLPMDSRVLLYSGSLSPSRRVDHLIRAFAIVVKSGFPNTFFLIVGGVPAADSSTEKRVLMDLKNLCAELGVPDRVCFTGWLPYIEALRLYRVADVGVVFLPKGTPYELQPPTKLIEYMMAGLLAVGNDVPGVSQYIEDGRTGILCGNSVEELASGMKRALQIIVEQPEMLDKMKHEAYCKVKRFDWSNIVKDHVLPIYLQLLR